MFGYIKEHDPSIGIDDIWGPLCEDNYTAAIEVLERIVEQDARFLGPEDGVLDFRINVDNTGSPEIFYVTYRLAASNPNPVQTDIFSILWPDDS